MHATHYQHPAAQRQVMRVVMMPCVYAIVSFFAYRYYQEYEYYLLAETAYEAVTLSAFLMLLMELVAMSTEKGDISYVLQDKDKRKLPFPFNFVRFRASKPYFMHVLSFSVMQYVIIRPLITIVGIITQYFNVLCPQKYSVHFAEVYLDSVDFISISFALYGLIVFYVLCKGELKGRKPLNKFLTIKLIVIFTFYQGFMFSILQNYDVIKGTTYWTAGNVADGLQALCTTVEMVIFSAYMCWAYSWNEYTDAERSPQRPTGVKTYFQAIWDTVNFTDFIIEIGLAVKFFVAFVMGKPGTHASASRFQQMFIPEDGSERDMAMKRMPVNGGLRGGVLPPPEKSRRTPSGNLIPVARSPSDYQRLREGNSPHRYTDPGNGSADPYAASRPGPTHSYAAGQTPSQQEQYQPPTSHPYAQQRSSYNAYIPQPTPHPYGLQPSPNPHRPQRSPSDVNSNGQYPIPPSAHYPIQPQAFPSAHPTGPTSPATATADTGQSRYITPSEWTTALRDEEGRYGQEQGQQWSGQAGQRNSNQGIPGNPRLY